MILKLSQVAIVLAFISMTSQLELANKKRNGNLYHAVDLKEIVQNEVWDQLHPSAHRAHKKRPDMPSANLYNIQNLNYYNDPKSAFNEKFVKRFNDRENLRNDDDDERLDEVQQVLDELESELAKVDALRCSSDRCSDSLREGDDRCGCRPRSEDQEEDVRDDENRGEKDRDQDDPEDDDDKSLRCRSDRCGKTRTRSDTDLKSQLERYGKKYKINNELDAIVLDLSNLNGLLGKVKNNRYRNVNFNKRKQDLNLNVQDSDDKLDFVDAFIVDLDRENDGDTLENRAYTPVFQTNYDDSSKSSYFDSLFGAKNRYSSNKVLNYIKNKRGNRNLLSFSNTQKNQLKNLESQLQTLDSDEDELKVLLKRLLFDSENSNSNRKVYLTNKLPRTDENHSNNDERLRTKKSLFPLTVKQKQKAYKNVVINKPVVASSPRRSGDQYGLPFELQVEGLGQIES